MYKKTTQIKFSFLFVLIYWLSVIIEYYFSNSSAHQFVYAILSDAYSNFPLYGTLLFLSSIGFAYTGYCFPKLLPDKNPNKIIPELHPYPDTYNELTAVLGEVHDRIEKNKKNSFPEWLTLPGRGLYTGMIIFGTTGTGKTAAFLYPLLENLLNYKHNKQDDKISGLILDVKGDFNNMTYHYAIKHNRCKLKKYAEERIKYSKNYSSLKARDFEFSDIIRIAVDGDYKWNPVWRPGDSGDIIAADLTIVLENLSGKDSHNQYWIDNAKKHLANTIDLLGMSLYNPDYREQPGYFTFQNLYYTIISEAEIHDHLRYSRENIEKNGENDVLNKSYLNYLEKYFIQDYGQLEERIRKIIESEINRMLNFFTKPRFAKTFCPRESEARKSKYFFPGFRDCIHKGIIVVGDLPVAKYSSVAVTISILLKQAFRKASLERISEQNANRNYNISRPLMFMCDEYQNFISPLDADFFDKSRQAKVIPIVATQTLSSLLNAVNKDQAVKVIMDNLANKIFLRTTSQDTAEWASKLSGQIERIRINRSVNESKSKQKKSSFINYLFGSGGIEKGGQDSQSLNLGFHKNKEALFEPNDFLQLDTFQAILCQGSDGYNTLQPSRIYAKPYFFDKHLDYFSNIKKIQEHESKKIQIKQQLQIILEEKPTNIVKLLKCLNIPELSDADLIMKLLVENDITINAEIDKSISTYTKFRQTSSEDNDDLMLAKLEQLSEDIDNSEDSLIYDLDYLNALNEEKAVVQNNQSEKPQKIPTKPKPKKQSSKVDSKTLISNISNPIYNKYEEVY